TSVGTLWYGLMSRRSSGKLESSTLRTSMLMLFSARTIRALWLKMQAGLEYRVITARRPGPAPKLFQSSVTVSLFPVNDQAVDDQAVDERAVGGEASVRSAGRYAATDRIPGRQLT